MNRNPKHKQRLDGIGTFEDLTVYQVARQLRKAMYLVATELPAIEKFGLTSQIRRAAVSLTNNIAEGHGRFHYLEQIKFMFQARGSLQELLDDLNACEDENYLPVDRIEQLKQDGWRVRQLIDGYIAYLRRRKATDLKIRDDPPETDVRGESTHHACTNYESTNYESP